jgi:non-ribosomal peptide synthetase component F/acyl carrier protein
VPVIASFSFDISLFELLPPLLCGATAVVFSKAHVIDVPRLVESLESATMLHAVPSLMRQIVGVFKEAGGGRWPRSMRRVYVGGDAVAPELLEQMQSVFAESRIEVLYGPTEATIICASYEVPRGTMRRRQMIGRPLGNVLVRVEDRHGNPVPVGVAGELCIGGAGVTRGYLNREELNREKYFVRDGQRYYRSGDLVRYLPDGNIEFLGRTDEQVKVRGFRVELGEIESVLGQHAAVRECVVVAREDESDERRLVAYLVGDTGREVAVNELRGYLKERLPEYMVPAAFVTLDSIPLTSNGKVDRRRLPAPESAAMPLGQETAAPSTPTEEIICSLFAQILSLPGVGVGDNFFEVGGHSLLATQLVSRLRQVFGIELPLRSLFDAPTAAELARVVEAEMGQGEEAAPSMKAVSREGELPLSFAQQRLWFIDQLEPGSSFYNIPAAVRMTGNLDIEALEETLTEVVRRHEVLRTSFPTADGKPRQVIAPAAPLTLEVEELGHLPQQEREREVTRLAVEEARKPFDLAAGPLLRARLLRLAEEEHVLLFTLHHIVSDGWSMSVLIKEVGTLYEAFIRGEQSPLEELPIQYADFALWQREWLSGEVMERQLNYWRRQLGGELPILELPTDRPRPAVQSYRGGHHSFRLSPEVSAGLRELSQREGVTLFMTLLAAWQTLLSRYSGQEEVIVGTDIANRNRAETEGLIGFFVNQLVLRTDLAGDPSFVELLRRVREVCLGAYAHQDVPFERLVEELAPERDASRSPLYQVKFVWQNTAVAELELAGVRLQALGGETGTAKMELMLVMAESGESISGRVEYNTDLYSVERAARMCGHLEQLFESIVARPEARLDELEILTDEERQERVSKKKARKESNMKKLLSTRRKNV